MSCDKGADDKAVAQGLSSLTRLDRLLWQVTIERQLRNPNSAIRLHISKDGATAPVLDLVGRLWLTWVGGLNLLVGIVLLSLPASIVGLEIIGWFFVSLGLMGFVIGMVSGIRASKVRRARRRQAK